MLLSAVVCWRTQITTFTARCKTHISHFKCKLNRYKYIIKVLPYRHRRKIQHQFYTAQSHQVDKGSRLHAARPDKMDLVFL